MRTPSLKSSATASSLSLVARLLLPVALLSSIMVVLTSANSIRPQSAAPRTASPVALQTGKQIWTASCAGCHGVDGRGGEHAPNIATKPEALRLSDGEIFRIVRDGSLSMAMPSFRSSLDKSKISAVVSYLRSLQGGQRYESLPGDPQAGASLFYGKAGCAGCHMAGTAGGFMGSDLTEYARTHPISEIRDAITNPNKDLDPRKRIAVVITLDSEKFTGIARNEDNFSLQLQTSDGTFHLFLKSDLQKFEYQPESLMPSDYGSRLSSDELNDLISFLMRTARSKTPQASSAARPEPHDANR
jgi:cytochrome c oxidase cbb3-type subunit III